MLRTLLNRVCLSALMGSIVFFPHWSFGEEVAKCKSLTISGNPEYPPYLFRKSENTKNLIGANADFAKALGKEIGMKVSVVYVGTWARVQEEVRAGRIDMIAGAFFTLPRLEYMDYFYPAFKETRTMIWVRQDSKMKFEKWADLEGKTGLTVINNSFGEEFDSYAKKSLKIHYVPTLPQALTMMENSRADYLIYEEAPGMAYIAKQNITTLKTVGPSVTEEMLYMTMSHKSPCNTGELRGKISKAVYNLTQQKIMEAFINSGIQKWKKSELP